MSYEGYFVFSLILFFVILLSIPPFKGQVLNQIAAKFLDATSDILPNWKIAVPDPMVTVGHRCEPYKVEMVIRGYLSGHAGAAVNCLFLGNDDLIINRFGFYSQIKICGPTHGAYARAPVMKTFFE